MAAHERGRNPLDAAEGGFTAADRAMEALSRLRNGVGAPEPELAEHDIDIWGDQFSRRATPYGIPYGYTHLTVTHMRHIGTAFPDGVEERYSLSLLHQPAVGERNDDNAETYNLAWRIDGTVLLGGQPVYEAGQAVAAGDEQGAIERQLQLQYLQQELERLGQGYDEAY